MLPCRAAAQPGTPPSQVVITSRGWASVIEVLLWRSDPVRFHCRSQRTAEVLRGYWMCPAWGTVGPRHAVPTSRCHAATSPARTGALFSVASCCGCALNSITKKPSPKIFGFLCGLCDGDPDELPRCPDHVGVPAVALLCGWLSRGAVTPRWAPMRPRDELPDRCSPTWGLRVPALGGVPGLPH